MIESSTVAKNAIDIDLFRFNGSIREAVRKELGVEDRFVIGNIGRFCHQNNQSFLIDVFDKIHSFRKKPVLMLAGDGEDFEEMKQQVHSRGLEDCVKFLGYRNDCPRLYQAMDVFVCPTKGENSGLTVLEAQACGVPCVVSEHLPKNVIVTNMVKVVALSRNILDWALIVLRMGARGFSDNIEALRASGFDIKHEAERSKANYVECLKRQKYK
ncbi:MAG: glycosyltransferase [Succinivibrio sp.]